jgi:DNA-binding beta-propeller fold protein YncE
VDAGSGEILSVVQTNSGAHNTIAGLDGKHVYLAGLRSPVLSILDTNVNEVTAKCGPFSAPVRPFTVNAEQTHVYACVNALLGFEIGDLKSGAVLHKVEVPGFEKGTVKRHGCPSHGIGLTPNENEVWVCDGANQSLHVFDNRSLPPKYVSSIKLFDDPGWVTFSLDGSYAWPSTLEVIDTGTKKIVTALKDEQGRRVQSEKIVEVQLLNGEAVKTGDQFGMGRAKN